MPGLLPAQSDAGMPNKRQRTDSNVAIRTKPKTATHSKIFAPFRALGHVTSAHTPFTLLPLGTKTFHITTSVGVSFQTYDVRHLKLVFVSSPQTPSPIQRLFAYKDVVLAAFAEGVWIFKRGKKIAELEAPIGGWEGKGEWRELLVFGDWVVGGFAGGQVLAWRYEKREFYTEISSPIVSGKEAEVRGIVHPSTYLNKIVVARESGSLEIWNLKTGKLIYNITLRPSHATDYSTIVSMVQTPALHTLAIAFSSGEVIIHNIILDETIMTLKHDVLSAKNKRATSISFCTDASVGSGESGGAKDVGDGAGRIMAVADSEGDVTIWDLEKKRVTGVLRSAHVGQITRVEFLVGQNVMVTGGADNSVREWIFDSPHTPLPRLLRLRGGHSQPATTLTFYNPEESHFLLSSSQDQSLWGLSLRSDAQNFEFSQGAGTGAAAKNKEKIAEKRAGPITALAVVPDTGLAKDWEGIVTAHRGERAARTWWFKNKKVGRWVFETPDKTEVKSVAVSACGNFGFVGSAMGAIEMYNLQSGIRRKRFPEFRGMGKTAVRLPGKHEKAVTAILPDAVNQTVISTGLDGKIKFWSFSTGEMMHEIDWSDSTSIVSARLHTPTDLLAVACDDLCIRVIDVGTKKTVRELWGCSGRITDFCFSPDGRWLLASSLDGALRIWDLPTGHLIDGLRTPNIITALAFSGTGEYLATAHVGDVGINLWTNRTMFRANAPTRAISDSDIFKIEGPKASGEGGTSIANLATQEQEEEDSASTGVYTTAEQLTKELLTLSLQPQNRWQTLLHLDIIKERSKPVEAPKKPEKAPFFLSLLSNSKDTPSSLVPAAAEPDSRILVQPLNPTDSISNYLSSAKKLIPYLLSLSPTQASFQIHSLSPAPPYEEFIAFVEAVTERCESNKDWEMCLVWMRVFLKAWGDVVAECVEGKGEEEEDKWEGMDEDEEDDEKEAGAERLVEALRKWKEVSEGRAKRIKELGGWCSGVVGFMRGL